MNKYLGAFITLVAAAAAALVIIALLGNFAHLRPPATANTVGQAVAANGQTLTHATITLQVFPFDPYTDPDFVNSHITGKTDNGFAWPGPGDNQAWVKYEPTTDLFLPRNALVTINIENYDSATPLLNPYYSTPQGIEGAMLVGGQPVSSVDPSNVSHTFTIHSIPQSGQDWFYVSVPITGADPSAKADAAGLPLQPLVTSFTIRTPSRPGKYIWQCFDPCGSNYNGFGGPMSTKGYMSGTITVQ